jgi:hypothetical protein
MLRAPSWRTPRAIVERRLTLIQNDDHRDDTKKQDGRD